MGIVSQKLRDSARGQPCTLELPSGICNHNPETTVLAHLPSEVKGMSTKSDDFFAAYSCSACHEAMDQHRFWADDEAFFWLRGLGRTHKVMRDMGLIVIAGDNPKPRPTSSKILPRKPMTVRP